MTDEPTKQKWCGSSHITQQPEFYCWFVVPAIDINEKCYGTWITRFPPFVASGHPDYKSMTKTEIRSLAMEEYNRLVGVHGTDNVIVDMKDGCSIGRGHILPRVEEAKASGELPPVVLGTPDFSWEDDE